MSETQESETAPKQTKRFVVLGAGRIGAMHARMLARDVADAELVGLFDVFDESARTLADELGVAVYESAESACAAPADAVVICTPTSTHTELIELAAAKGKDIFCEKPLSLDIAEIERCITAVNAAKVKLHVAFNRRFDPSHRRVATAVANGDIGTLRQIHIVSRDPAPPPLSYIEQSGGMFADMTIHDFDMAAYIADSPIQKVYATGAVTVDPAIGEAGDIDTASIVLTHKNGVVTTIENCRQSAYGYDQRVEAFGSKGVARSANRHSDTAEICTAEGKTESPLQHFFLERYTQSYLDQWKEFVDVLQGKADICVGGVAGRAAVLVGSAAALSVQENRVVDITEIGETRSNSDHE